MTDTRKSIPVSNLTLDLYLDYVKPAAIAAGLAEKIQIHDRTRGEYTACHTDAATADEIAHCMYCAAMNTHNYYHDYSRRAVAAQMLYQLEVSAQYRSETAEAMTALRHELSKMIADDNPEGEKPSTAPADDGELTDTDDTEKEDNTMTNEYILTHTPAQIAQTHSAADILAELRCMPFTVDEAADLFGGNDPADLADELPNVEQAEECLTQWYDEVMDDDDNPTPRPCTAEELALTWHLYAAWYLADNTDDNPEGFAPSIAPAEQPTDNTQRPAEADALDDPDADKSLYYHGYINDKTLPSIA